MAEGLCRAQPLSLRADLRSRLLPPGRGSRTGVSVFAATLHLHSCYGDKAAPRLAMPTTQRSVAAMALCQSSISLTRAVCVVRVCRVNSEKMLKYQCKVVCGCRPPMLSLSPHNLSVEPAPPKHHYVTCLTCTRCKLVFTGVYVLGLGEG